jgi:hypothetical protein
LEVPYTEPGPLDRTTMAGVNGASGHSRQPPPRVAEPLGLQGFMNFGRGNGKPPFSNR